MTSTAIYTCYRQLHPPTGVDHAIFGSVTAAGSRDLVVAKASILELYRVRRVAPKESAAADDPAAAAAAAAAPAAGGGGTGDDDGDDTSFYLELAGTFPLAGNITSLAVLPVASSLAAASSAAAAAGAAAPARPRRQQDVLVVSFGQAKMALVAYDALLGRLETVSIHNFDAGAIGPGAAGVETGYGLASALKNRPGTVTSSDPAGRCLAAVVAGYQLVVVPARRYVPRSVFVSEESAKRAGALRARRRAAAAAEARGTEEGDVSFNNGGSGGSGGRDAGGAAGGESGSEGDGSVGGGESESEVDEEEEGGDGSGARSAVAKPFTIDLEEAGITG